MENESKYSIKVKESKYESVKVTSSESMSEVARRYFSDDIEVYESFFMVMLNNSNITQGHVKISQGGIVGTVVDIRIICKYAIESLATAVIVCHNHPSGKTTPSTQDLDITAKIKAALAMFEIQLLDHIILTKDSYCSFADEGLL